MYNASPNGEHDDSRYGRAEQAVYISDNARREKQQKTGGVGEGADPIRQENAMLPRLENRHRNVLAEQLSARPGGRVCASALAQVGHLQPVTEREIAVELQQGIQIGALRAFVWVIGVGCERVGVVVSEGKALLRYGRHAGKFVYDFRAAAPK